MSRWGVSTSTKVWRSVEVEADTLDEALALAVADSQEWGDDQDEALSFGSWDAGETARIDAYPDGAE